MLNVDMGYLEGWSVPTQVRALSVIEFEVESWFRNKQFQFKKPGNCTAQLFVDIRAQTSNRKKLSICSMLLCSTKCYRYRSFQNDHHISFGFADDLGDGGRSFGEDGRGVDAVEADFGRDVQTRHCFVELQNPIIMILTSNVLLYSMYVIARDKMFNLCSLGFN